jgi:hypothetical protein
METKGQVRHWKQDYSVLSTKLEQRCQAAKARDVIFRRIKMYSVQYGKKPSSIR